MTGLLDQIADPRHLRAAWEHVVDRDAADGVRSSGVVRFEEDLAANLERLSAEVVSGTYSPGRMFAVDIPKDDGGTRTLLIGQAQDRVLERSAASVLSPLVDPRLSHASFGYRPGLGVGDAVRRLVELREEGLSWVVRSDIDDCFPSVRPSIAIKALESVIADRSVSDLVASLLSFDRRPRDHRRGLPQGSSLSPLLSNLVLDGLDRALLAAGHQIVRFADDFVVVAVSEEHAKEALAMARKALEKVGLTLGEEDTAILNFGQGFAFLGEDFNSRYPPTGQGGIDEPRRRVLYVGHQGSYVALRSGRLIVLRGKQVVLSVPSGHVGRLVLAGAVGLSSAVRSWALATDVEVVFLSRRGSFQGALAGASTGTVKRRRDQYRLTDDSGFRLELARRFVAGKLGNQQALLLRFNRRTCSDAVGVVAGEIGRTVEMVSGAESVDQLSGVEGLAARKYFSGYGHLLPDELPWSGRTRRPPLDVVNAALSYGYAILNGETISALHAAGLDPNLGFLHGDARSRPSLALDLMEEFRPIVVDSVVLEMFRRGSLGIESGRVEEGRSGVFLTEKARRALIGKIEERLLTTSHYPPLGRKESRRRQIYLQGSQLSVCIEKANPAYQPVIWR